MPSTDLIRRAIAVNAANLAIGHETFEAGGARFVRDRAAPSIRDANHVTRVTAGTPDEIDSLLARAAREFEGFPHIVFHLDFDTPPAFEARLQLDGYTRNDALVMLLEGDLRADSRPCDIRPVESGDDWAAFRALQRIDWHEYEEKLERPASAAVGELMADTRQAKSPPVRYWLAYEDEAPRGYFSSWEGTDGIGQVEDLFVHPDWRKRGFATALLRHCVDDCRKHGAGPVVIVADPTDTPKNIYARMGWQPVAIKRDYRIEMEIGG